MTSRVSQYYRDDCPDCRSGRYHFHVTSKPYGIVEMNGWHGARAGELRNDLTAFQVPE